MLARFPRWIATAALVTAAIAAAVLLAAAVARAATPAVVSVHASDTQATFQTALIGGAAADRADCVQGTTCDTLHVVLEPGDWTGRQIVVSIDWLNPGSDFDLYLFEDHVDGESDGISNGGAPQTHEGAPVAVNAVLTGPRTIAVQVVSFATTPEQVQGTVSVTATPAPRSAIFSLANDVAFCPNVTVTAPGASRDCEPSLRVDVRGNCYAGGIRGVPGGVDLWRFDLDPSSPGWDPQLRSPVYLGQPDAFAPNDTTGGRDGGGDIDIATSFPAGAAEVPVVTVVSLAAANVSSAVSTDRGENFTLSPAVAAVPADDRQWLEAAGPDTVYLLYRAPIPATGLWVQRSTDHGLTYPQTALVSPTGTTPGDIAVDRANGYVYAAHMSSSALFVSRSTDGGMTWSTSTVDNSTGHRHIFDAVKVGLDGTVYAAWSDDHAIWLAHSSDHAATWSPPVKVSGPETHFALFPWLECGSSGRVAVVWYGSTSDVNSNAADWRCWSALTLDATAQDPTVRIVQVSDHVIHASNLSEGGLGLPVVEPSPNRNLCDYFQVAVDPLGAMVVALTDDHNDYDGHTWLARQLSGPSLYAAANGGTGVLTPMDPLPLPAPDPSQPEISDFLHDASGGGLQVIPADNPWDILSIDYGCNVQGAAAQLQVKMKVSQLSPVPANAVWRVNFAANAPGSTADRGDQFFLRAMTDTAAVASFVFGSAIRDSSGAMAYTVLGDADSGQLDTSTNEVVMRLALSRLDPYVTHGGPVRPGSMLVGLRGQTGTAGAGTARDITRGFDSFEVCSEVVGVEPHARPGDFGMSAPTPNPGRGGAAVNLSLARTAWVELAVFDSQGRRTRTVHAGTLPAGVTRLAWDGRTDSGHPAASGAYFLRMMAGGEKVTQHLVLVR